MTAVWCFEAIGTHWQVDTEVELPDRVRASALAIAEGFDRRWSRFRHDSTASRLRSEPSVDLGPDAPAIFALFDRLDEVTGGAVNPCVGASLERLGYDPVYSLTVKGEPLPVPSWDDCSHDGTVLTVPAPVVLDIGAVGKGYLADLLADHLGRFVDGGCVVDASGDIVNASGDTLRIALEHPADPTSAIGVVELPPGSAICGSARNRRAWGAGLHHVIDPRTGIPTQGIAATWAVAPSGVLADGLSTALFFAEPDELANWNIGWVVLGDDGSLDTNLTGEFFV